MALYFPGQQCQIDIFALTFCTEYALSQEYECTLHSAYFGFLVGNVNGALFMALCFPGQQCHIKIFARNMRSLENTSVMLTFCLFCSSKWNAVPCWQFAYILPKSYIGNLHTYLPRMTFNDEVEHTLHIWRQNVTMEYNTAYCVWGVWRLCLGWKKEWVGVFCGSLFCVYRSLFNLLRVGCDFFKLEFQSSI